MAKTFDPRKVLRKVSNTRLRELFARRGLLSELDWDRMSESRIEPIYVAWQNLPEGPRREVQGVLQSVNELADERGIGLLAEEVRRRQPDRIEELGAVPSRCDKVLWAYLETPEAFEEAALFAHVDALEGGRSWVTRNGLPRKALAVDRRSCEELRKAVGAFYREQQLRGHFGAVEHYERGDGDQYFFAYLSDYPDTDVVFAESGELQRRLQRHAFENVFAFSPTDGTLSVFARGGGKVNAELHRAFCKSVMNLDIDPSEPIRPVYRLDGLLYPNFQFTTEAADRIAQVRLTRIRLVPVDESRELEHDELKFTASASPARVHEIIRHRLNSIGLAHHQVEVRQAGFRLTFHGDGKGRPKILSFNVGEPDACDLKSKPDEMRVIGERCLRLWGITYG